jgi:hypothetical protein
MQGQSLPAGSVAALMRGKPTEAEAHLILGGAIRNVPERQPRRFR